MADFLSDVADFAIGVRALLAEAPAFPGSEIGRHLVDFLADARLPVHLTQPAPDRYRRQMLHQEADGRFSIGCFVWGPGQQTPIHDHHAWGVIGVASGILRSESYSPGPDGQLVLTARSQIAAGTATWVHPASGDIHRIGTALPHPAVSIHIYGCPFDSVCRNTYLPAQASVARAG